MIKGIDVSHWQGKIDFAKVKSAGFSFVIIKAGGADCGMYTDKCFETYYKDAVAAGLGVGAYYFTSKFFSTKAQGVKEANHFLKIIKGKKFDYPVWCDVEAVPISAGRYNITKAACGFCDTMEKAGYYCGIYASDISGFKSRMILENLAKYDKWVARYNTDGPQYVQTYGIWQYGGSANCKASPKVTGVTSAECDQNFAYKDYPSIIKKARLNGFEDSDNIKKYYIVSTDIMTEGDKNAVTKLLDDLRIKYSISTKEVQE